MTANKIAFCVLLLIGVANTASATQPADTAIHPLHAKRQEVLRMSGIIRDLAAGASSTRNAAIGRDMHHVAERCAEYLDAVEEFLKLSERMKDPSDRFSADFVLDLRLLIYIDALDARIREVNVGLANATGDTSQEGIPTAALTLLDRMAEAKDLMRNLEAETKTKLNAKTKR